MEEKSTPLGEKPDARTYFAAERTLLAWIRTGLSMMGFGFVVARFGLFLRELAATPGVHVPPHTGVSLWIGTLLVLCGVIVNIAAAVSHAQTLKRLERSEPLRIRVWSMGLFVSLAIAVIGLLMAAYLMLGLSH